jgi:hypothetical protein
MGQADLLPEQLGGVLRLSESSRFFVFRMVPLSGSPEPAEVSVGDADVFARGAQARLGLYSGRCGRFGTAAAYAIE